MSKVAHLDDSTFEQKTSNGIALVDFWAPWCGPCKMLGPILEEVAEELGPAVVVAKVNVDESPVLAQRFNVMSIPAIFVMKDGKQVNQMIGLQDKNTLLNAVREA